MYGIIYCATNLQNKKKYIGQTVNSLECRKRQHEAKAVRKKRHQYFHNALAKNNFNFVWEILEECNSRRELDEKEISYIKQLNSFGKDGYNLTPGGDGNRKYSFTKEEEEFIIRKRKELNSRPKVLELFNKKFNRDVKSVHSLILILCKHLSKKEEGEITHLVNSRNSKARIETSQSKLNRSKAQKGKEASKETLEKMRKVRMGFKHSEESLKTMSKNNKRKVIFTEEQKQFIYNSIKKDKIAKYKLLQILNEKYGFNLNLTSNTVIDRVIHEIDPSHNYVKNKYVYKKRS